MQYLFPQYANFEGTPFERELLLALSNSILVLLLITVAFALLALALRVQHNRHDRLWRGLHALWDKDILDVLKVLSSDRAPLIGIRRLLGLEANAPIPPCEVRLGTTLATNALITRRFPPAVMTAEIRIAFKASDQPSPICSGTRLRRRWDSPRRMTTMATPRRRWNTSAVSSCLV